MKSQKKLVTIVLLLFVLALTAVLVVGCAKQAAKVPSLILATTTSTVDTGLLDFLVPKFENKTGYKVKTVGVGTGQALAMGQKGEADVILCHAPKSETPLVTAKDVTDYQLVMHNDFVIVGPANDPAGIKGLKKPDEALQKIAASKSLFISRGDNSGTQKKELDLWTKAGIKPAGSWYQQSGAGMGQTLLMTSEKNGYTLADRGTFLAQQKNIQLAVLVEGDKTLLNIYHVMEVSKDKFPKVNSEGAKAFVEFMTAPDTQKLIANFGKEEYGVPLFIADAGKKEADIGK